MTTPYIGICDVDSGEQAKRFLDYFDTRNELVYHRLMIGVMMSKKSLTGEPTKWAEVWPDKEDVTEIFIDHHRAYNCLHYADYSGPNVYDTDSLCRAIEYGGPNLHAVQLDMIWPDPDMLYETNQRFPHLDFVLQLGGKAMDMLDNDHDRIIEALSGSVACMPKYVLLDGSMGTGKPIDADKALPLLLKIREAFPYLGLAIAGGIGPRSVNTVLELCEHVTLSMDAQSKLRPSGLAMDPIDEVYVEAMLDKLDRGFAHLRRLNRF